MTLRRLTKDQVRVRDTIAERQSVPATARTLRMKERRVRTIVAQLVSLGELRRDPNSNYPVLYFDPKAPLSGSENKDCKVGRETTIQKQGAASEKRSPEQTRVHLNGMMYCKIRNVGRMETLRDKRGFAIGDWTSEGRPMGSIEHRGFLSHSGVKIGFAYRKGKNSDTFYIWPQDTYQTAPEALKKGKNVLIDRVEAVKEVLHEYGWSFFDTEVRGTIEGGHIDHPFAERMDRKHVNAFAPVKVDTSPGVPEVEVSDEVANDLLSYTPEHITQLYVNDDDMIQRMAKLEARLDTSERVQDKLVMAQEKNIILFGQQTEINDGLTKQHKAPQYATSGYSFEEGGMYR